MWSEGGKVNCHGLVKQAEHRAHPSAAASRTQALLETSDSPGGAVGHGVWRRPVEIDAHSPPQTNRAWTIARPFGGLLGPSARHLSLAPAIDLAPTRIRTDSTPLLHVGGVRPRTIAIHHCATAQPPGAMDSGTEVLRITAAIVSAFQTAADTLEVIKERKEKKKRKKDKDVEELIQVKILLASLVEVSAPPLTLTNLQLTEKSNRAQTDVVNTARTDRSSSPPPSRLATTFVSTLLKTSSSRCRLSLSKPCDLRAPSKMPPSTSPPCTRRPSPIAKILQEPWINLANGSWLACNSNQHMA